MKTILRPLGIATLAIGALPVIGSAQSCNSMIQSLNTWLTGGVGVTRYVTAYVSSHASNHSVTYAAVPMKAGAGFSIGWLFSSQTGKQYYSENEYCLPPGGFGCTQYPFSPYITKTLSLTVSPSGSVTVKPNGGAVTHSFSGTCTGGIMYGFNATTLSLNGIPFTIWNPLYAITFAKYEVAIPK